VLTGNGGDELTSGSNYLFLHRLLRGDPRGVFEIAAHCKRHGLSFPQHVYALLLRPFIPAKLRQALRQRRSASGAHPHPWPKWINETAARELNLEQRLYASPALSPWHAARADRAQLLESHEHTSLAATYAALAAPLGMEARHPFADRRLIEFAFALPETMSAQGDFNKRLLREATRELLPRVVTERADKTQFSAVYGHRLEAQRSYIDEALSHPYLADTGVLDTNTLRAEFWQDRRSRQELDMAELYCVLSLQLWLSLHFRPHQVPG